MDYGAYKGRTLVIKISGKVVGDEPALRLTVNQLIGLKAAGCSVILIHGGGDQIDEDLDSRGIAYHKIDGVRFTSEEALPVVQECLTALNEKVVALFDEEARKQGIAMQAAGVDAVDASMILAQEKFAGSRTGKVGQLDSEKLRQLLDGERVPILHSVCRGSDGHFNVNADELAMPIAENLAADRLIFCSNTCMKDAEGAPLARLSDTDIDRLIADGTIHNGAVVKVLACKEILLSGRVGEVVILNGRDGSLVKELQNDPGAGTHIFLAEGSR